MRKRGSDIEGWQKEHYAQTAADYVRWHFKHEIRIEKMLSLLPRSGISRALDLGCANGFFLRSLPACTEKFGIDIVPRKIEGARFMQRNLDDGIPFRDEYFDLVIAGEIIEHIYDTGKLLGECNRVLKKGGCLLLSTPNIGSLYNIVNNIRGRQPNYVQYDKGLSGHIRYYSANALHRQLAECGFVVERFTSDRIYLPFWVYLKPVNWLRIRLGGIMPRFGDILIVRARKA